MGKSLPGEYERWDTCADTKAWYSMVPAWNREELRVSGESVRKGVGGQGDATEEKGSVKSLQWHTEEFGLSLELQSHKISLKLGI